MKKGGAIGKCVEVVLKLSKISAIIPDNFFVAKINQTSEELLLAYLNFDKNEGTDNVAQYRTMFFHKTIEHVLDILNELQYLNLAPTTSLLSAQKTLLELRILTTLTVQPEKHLEARSQDESDGKTADRKKNFPPAKLTENQEQILKFINRAKTVRTRDIIDGFGNLSQRTVKRNLRELVGQGRLQKKAENKAVYYSVTS